MAWATERDRLVEYFTVGDSVMVLCVRPDVEEPDVLELPLDQPALRRFVATFGRLGGVRDLVAMAWRKRWTTRRCPSAVPDIRNTLRVWSHTIRSRLDTDFGDWRNVAGMGEGPRQLLVVLDGARAEEAQIELRRHFDVSDVASPRVLVVWDQGDQAAVISAVAGVASVVDGEIPAGVLESLDDGERLFARAWEERQRSGPKERKGEGLSWDSPGFTPPDQPR